MRNNPYEQRYPYSNIRGAFYSILSQMPNDVITSVEHSGQTFAISGTFKYLSFAHFITRTGKHGVYHRTVTNRPVQKNVTLYIASDFVLNVCGLSPSEAQAAGLHEGGHGLCDMAGSEYPTEKEFDENILPYIQEKQQVYSQADLPKWVNVLADGRLERGISLLIPGSDKYFFAIQNWCHRLEADNRGKEKSSDFMMALRDSVKGWDCDSARQVYSEYLPEARELVEELKPIWSKVIPKNTKWDQTVHLPLQAALEIVNAIKDLHEMQGQDPNKSQDQQESGGQGQQDQQSEDEDQEGGSEDQEGGSQGQEGGSEDQEGDSQGQGGGSEDQGGGSEDQEGGSEDQEGGSQGQGGESEGQGGESEGQEGGDSVGSGSGKGSNLELLESLLSGQGSALDPGSALPRNVAKVEQELGHRIYVPNCIPHTEEKMRL